jgi:hypothetical protein
MRLSGLPMTWAHTVPAGWGAEPFLERCQFCLGVHFWGVEWRSHRFINLLEFADALRLGAFPGSPSGPEETGAPMAHGHHKQKHFHEPQIRR